MKSVKKQLKTKEVYLSIISKLKTGTNLNQIIEDLNISKQNLNNYLKRLKEMGFIIHKDKGWYELTNKCKNSTNYDNFLPKDFIRGHAYVWKINLNKKPKDWDKRIKILSKKQINYKLVGALKDVPRIKVLGRKIWLCKDSIRIFDKKDSSYYGDNSIESRNKAMNELFLIVGALERKLGVYLKPLDFEWAKEHYALIKNDLAIDQNRKGVIWRIKDKDGEWLLIDDSLEKGGELENIGKKSFKTNIKMQKWWNNQKETNFEVTPKFTLNLFNKLIIENTNLRKDLNYVAKNQVSHVKLIEKASNIMEKLDKKLSPVKKKRTSLRKFQTSLDQY